MVSDKTVSNLIVNATSMFSKSQRAFIPFTIEDGAQTSNDQHIPRKNFGFVPMQDGDVPEGLNLVAIRDPQEKMLAYFLLGGTLEKLDDFYDLMVDQDIILIIGTTLIDNRLEAVFFMDKFYGTNSMVDPKLIRRRFSYTKIIDKMRDHGITFSDL